MSTSRNAKQFSLRGVFRYVMVCAVVFAFSEFLYRQWFLPRNVGMAAQQRFDEAFAKNAWSGWAQVHFLDGRVCIASDIDDDGIKVLSPILEDIYWLKHLELFGTSISDDQLANLRQQLPNVHIDRRWGRTAEAVPNQL